MKKGIIEILKISSYEWHGQTVIYEKQFVEIAESIIKLCKPNDTICKKANQCAHTPGGLKCSENVVCPL